MVNGVSCNALVDTGCTKSIAHVTMCPGWTKHNVYVTTVSGEQYLCEGTGVVRVQLPSGVSACVEILVVTTKPLNFNFILGMDGVRAFKGVTVRAPNNVKLGVEESKHYGTVAAQLNHMIEERDFAVTYDAAARKWTVSWKWCNDTENPCLVNTTSEYRIKPDIREEYERELLQWIEDGWLISYDEKLHGPPKGTIPLMAVIQQNKGNKVRPVLDFRELNSYLTPHTADADVCSEKIREWRRYGKDVGLIDLRKAYLQIHVDSTLWPYQTVVFRGK